MSKGYVVIAQNTKKENYVDMAYGLALSIKNSQSSIKDFCIVTNDEVPEKYTEVFDYVVPIPWKDDAAHSKWKINNKWKYYYATPFDETIALDADMIFPEDISSWWDILSKKELWFTDKPRTFRGDIISSTRYRDAFVSNRLPNIYTAFMYFKKTNMCHEVFTLTELIFNNWEKFFYTYLDENRPKHLSGDVAYALALKILGLDYECTGSISNIPSFVHMKSYLQFINEKHISENWTESIPTYFENSGRFKIGNYQQTLPFHYHVKSWLTPEIIKILEKRLGI